MEENGKQGRPCNIALEYAKERYVVYVDADDVIDLANSRLSNAFSIGYTFPNPGYTLVGVGNGSILQVDTEADNTILVNRFNMFGDSIFCGNVMDVTNADNATVMLDYIISADSKYSILRSYFDVMQNRL